MSEWMGIFSIPCWFGAFFLYASASHDREKLRYAQKQILMINAVAEWYLNEEAKKEKRKEFERIIDNFSLGYNRLGYLLAVFFVFLGFFLALI
jgi:hypothetical protein